MYVSKPMKSANASGPIGILHPKSIELSILSAVATFSYKRNTASFIYGNNILFTKNPGESFDSTIVLPIYSPSFFVT